MFDKWELLLHLTNGSYEKVKLIGSVLLVVIQDCRKIIFERFDVKCGYLYNDNPFEYTLTAKIMADTSFEIY